MIMKTYTVRIICVLMKIYTSKLINKTVSIKAPKYSHRTFTTLQLYENFYYSYIYEPCTYNNFIL